MREKKTPENRESPVTDIEKQERVSLDLDERNGQIEENHTPLEPGPSHRPEPAPGRPGRKDANAFPGLVGGGQHVGNYHVRESPSLEGPSGWPASNRPEI